jgi:hypothetical protein
VAVIVVATVPLTGIGMWRDWLAGLDAYAASQRLVPGLYGFGLPRYVPWPAALALAAGAVVIALRWRGSTGLGRLAWTSAVASPSLWAHGFLVTIPALFMLNRTWLWFALALTSSVRGPGWVLALAVPPAAWTAAYLRRPRPSRGDVAPRERDVAPGNAAAPRNVAAALGDADVDWPAMPAADQPATARPASPGPRPGAD